MNTTHPAKDLQVLAESLASVAKVTKNLDVLIFGAGLGGLAMLEVLSQSEHVSIHSIIDISEDAPAFQLAHELGVNTSTDSSAELESFRGDIIIDVTGDASLRSKLIAFKREHQVELISAKSAKLLFDMANQELRSERTIETQNSRLSLLDCMLEITLQLESRPPIHDITSRSFADIHSHVHAISGLALIFDKQSKAPQCVGAIGENAPDCSEIESCQSCNGIILDACSRLSQKERYKLFKPSIQIKCQAIENCYNVALPLWQDTRLSGVLLFDIQAPLSKEQKTTLKMASVHLNMTFKTLDHFQQLEEMAIFDALTGVFNRRKFDMQLHQEVSRIKRMKNGTLTCGFIDLDDFKQINDTYGHQTGDLVLKHIATSIESCIRDYDLCARYGGDEFVILLPSDDAMQGSCLERIGMRILEKVANFDLVNAPEIKTSVSIGLVTQSGETAHAETLLKKADEALYEAKKSGKGCLRIFADEQFHYTPSKE
ncbi:diguanylate cyclase [Mariprofundus micogutta]|uniref:Diguanylate cyclase n=1 Tax=Mariprofundus micogutta TaxID=1921010 RepID=A0A1L8CMY9_9PROT|nr:GGDEF domain-containing protein [Mariprofundus micogutta]GAV20281.1 diguanylate cyclase [Mariprofundus micogutta]